MAAIAAGLCGRMPGAEGIGLRFKPIACRAVFGIVRLHTAGNVKFAAGVHAPPHAHVGTANQKVPFAAALLLGYGLQKRVSALDRTVVDQVTDIGIECISGRAALGMKSARTVAVSVTARLLFAAAPKSPDADRSTASITTNSRSSTNFLT